MLSLNKNISSNNSNSCDKKSLTIKVKKTNILCKKIKNKYKLHLSKIKISKNHKKPKILKTIEIKWPDKDISSKSGDIRNDNKNSIINERKLLFDTFEPASNYKHNHTLFNFIPNVKNSKIISPSFQKNIKLQSKTTKSYSPESLINSSKLDSVILNSQNPLKEFVENFSNQLVSKTDQNLSVSDQYQLPHIDNNIYYQNKNSFLLNSNTFSLNDRIHYKDTIYDSSHFDTNSIKFTKEFDNISIDNYLNSNNGIIEEFLKESQHSFIKKNPFDSHNINQINSRNNQQRIKRRYRPY